MTLCQMLERNYTDVLKMAAHLTRSKDKGSDLVSETLIWMETRNRNIPQIDKEFKSWYYRCMYYVSLAPQLGYQRMYYSREQLFEELEEPTDEETSTRNEEIGKVYDEVSDVIKSLTGVEKNLFELIYERGLSYKEIIYLYKKKTGYTLNEKRIGRLVKPMKEKLKSKWNI